MTSKRAPRAPRDARYDAKREPPITGRLSLTERERIAPHLLPRESLFQALKRLAGIADQPHNPN